MIMPCDDAQGNCTAHQPTLFGLLAHQAPALEPRWRCKSFLPDLPAQHAEIDRPCHAKTTTAALTLNTLMVLTCLYGLLTVRMTQGQGRARDAARPDGVGGAGARVRAAAPAARVPGPATRLLHVAALQGSFYAAGRSGICHLVRPASRARCCCIARLNRLVMDSRELHPGISLPVYVSGRLWLVRTCHVCTRIHSWPLAPDLHLACMQQAMSAA